MERIWELIHHRGRNMKRWKGLRAPKQGNLLHSHLLPLRISPEQASHRTYSLCVCMCARVKGHTHSLLCSFFPHRLTQRALKQQHSCSLSDVSVNPVSPGGQRSVYGLDWPITLPQIKLHQLIMSGDNEHVTWLCLTFLAAPFFPHALTQQSMPLSETRRLETQIFSFKKKEKSGTQNSTVPHVK